jgi:hypothetical protein
MRNPLVFVPWVIIVALPLSCNCGNEQDRTTKPSTVQVAKAPLSDTIPPAMPIDLVHLPDVQTLWAAVGYPLPEADTSGNCVIPYKFLVKSGEVWSLDTLSGELAPYTSSRGSIQSILSSPSAKYLACERASWVVKRKDESGEIHTEGEGWHVIVLQVCERRVIREIDIPTPGCIKPNRWISDSRLLLFSGDELDVYGEYVYDAFRDSLQEVSFDFVSQLREQ